MRIFLMCQQPIPHNSKNIEHFNLRISKNVTIFPYSKCIIQMEGYRAEKPLFGGEKWICFMDTVYLITGATGHLGNTIIRMLLEQKKRIRGLVMSGDNTQAME